MAEAVMNNGSVNVSPVEEKSLLEMAKEVEKNEKMPR